MHVPWNDHSWCFERSHFASWRRVITEMEDRVVGMLHLRWKKIGDLRAEISRVLAFHEMLGAIIEREIKNRKCAVCNETMTKCCGAYVRRPEDPQKLIYE